MRYRLLLLVSAALVLSSCWKFYNPRFVPDPGNTQKVWGYKPIYAPDSLAKKIDYSTGPRNSLSQGNIYAFHQFLFQLDPGLGIHVIDNSVPANAHKIGFLTVRGCAQISIKDDKLYTNSYDDLVVLDVSDWNNVHEYSRLKGVFVEYANGSPISRPPGSGYYECPQYGKFVIGWVRDSVYMACIN